MLLVHRQGDLGGHPARAERYCLQWLVLFYLLKKLNQDAYYWDELSLTVSLSTCLHTLQAIMDVANFLSNIIFVCLLPIIYQYPYFITLNSMTILESSLIRSSPRKYQSHDALQTMSSSTSKPCLDITFINCKCRLQQYDLLYYHKTRGKTRYHLK